MISGDDVNLQLCHLRECGHWMDLKAFPLADLGSLIKYSF